MGIDFIIHLISNVDVINSRFPNRSILKGCPAASKNQPIVCSSYRHSIIIEMLPDQHVDKYDLISLCTLGSLVWLLSV
jgi:hypothetical protein